MSAGDVPRETWPVRRSAPSQPGAPSSRVYKGAFTLAPAWPH
ncbi:hypothetical protein SGM_3575 [Streptomyces griseoaurantiacus M045]|uniref:Uncharacterized protein n=1 Tax=Streptomyces griseoaurantiacus M045 TaxID=996637 RepID=F3NKB1_9ACTN|nr:hypothetical protein SGM_3575 [Streptomyces griseoaurantiacus M045]